jgi:hypothetical protein
MEMQMKFHPNSAIVRWMKDDFLFKGKTDDNIQNLHIDDKLIP